MNRIDRLFGILLLLQSRRRVRAQDIAAKYEISERTVYRDIAALMQLGVPVVSQAGEGYWLLEGYFLPPLIFTPEEAESLFLGVKMLQASGNLPHHAQDVLAKLEAALPARTLRQIAPLLIMIDFLMEPGRFDLNTPHLVTVQQAIRDKQVLHVRYIKWNSSEVTERDIEPFGLMYSAGTWYIRAYCRLRRDMRSFRIERIEHLQVLNEYFSESHEQPPPDEPPLTVQIRFPQNMHRWVHERQHYGYKSEERDGDFIIMSYAIHELSEIQGWALRWGANAEVLSPAELREAILEEAKKLLSLLT